MFSPRPSHVIFNSLGSKVIHNGFRHKSFSQLATFATKARLQVRQATARSPALVAKPTSLRDRTRIAWTLKHGDEAQIYTAPRHITFHRVAYFTGTLWLFFGVNSLMIAYDKRSGYWATLLNEAIAFVTAFLAFRAFKSPHRLIKELWLERPKKVGSVATLRIVRQHHLSILGQKPVEEVAVNMTTITRHYDPTSDELLPRDTRLAEPSNLATEAKKNLFVRVKQELPFVYLWKTAPNTAFVSVPKEKSLLSWSDEKHFKLDGRGHMAARDGIIGLNLMPLREDV